MNILSVDHLKQQRTVRTGKKGGGKCGWPFLSPIFSSFVPWHAMEKEMQFQLHLLGQRGLFIKKESTKLVTWLERSVPQMLPQIPSPSSSGFLCRCLLDQQSGQGRQAREEEEATWVTQWYKTRKNALPTDPRPLCCACSEWSGAELCSLALQRGNGRKEKALRGIPHKSGGERTTKTMIVIRFL